MLCPLKFSLYTHSTSAPPPPLPPTYTSTHTYCTHESEARLSQSTRARWPRSDGGCVTARHCGPHSDAGPASESLAQRLGGSVVEGITRCAVAVDREAETRRDTERLGETRRAPCRAPGEIRRSPIPCRGGWRRRWSGGRRGEREAPSGGHLGGEGDRRQTRKEWGWRVRGRGGGKGGTKIREGTGERGRGTDKDREQ